MGVAAAALIVVVLAFGKLPGPIHGFTQSGHTSSVSPSASGSSGRSSVSPGGLQGAGSATKPPTASPTPARDRLTPSPTPSAGPASLCREVFDYPAHLESRDSWLGSYQQLGKLAGSLDPRRMYHYCVRVAGVTFHYEDPGTGPQEPQNQQDPKSEGKARANAAKADPSPAASSAPTAQSTAGSSNGNGSSGPGQGSHSGGPAPNS